MGGGSSVPVVVDPIVLDGYAVFPAGQDRDWLGRVCHLGAGELEQARRRSEDRSRLGYALQLVTVRAIGTFLPDPTAVPAPMLAAVARQLDITDPGALEGYRELAVRWRHTARRRQALPARSPHDQPQRPLPNHHPPAYQRTSTPPRPPITSPFRILFRSSSQAYI